MKKAYRTEWVGYIRAARIDAANRRRQQKRRGVSKEEFRQAMLELAARRRLDCEVSAN